MADAKTTAVLERAQTCDFDHKKLATSLEPTNDALAALAEQIAGLKVRANLAAQGLDDGPLRARHTNLASRLVAAERHMNKAQEELRYLCDNMCAINQELAWITKEVTAADTLAEGVT